MKYRDLFREWLILMLLLGVGNTALDALGFLGNGGFEKFIPRIPSYLIGMIWYHERNAKYRGEK